MKTSGFFDYRQGPGRVSIARFAPRGYPAGFRVFRALAPGQWFNKVSELEYRRLYLMEILRPLDPRRVWDDLHALVSPHEPVLLCYERQKDLETATTYCHRRIVALWLEEHLGVEVPELIGGSPRLSAMDSDRQLKLVCDGCRTPIVGGRCPTCLQSGWIPAGYQRQ